MVSVVGFVGFPRWPGLTSPVWLRRIIGCDERQKRKTWHFRDELMKQRVLWGFNVLCMEGCGTCNTNECTFRLPFNIMFIVVSIHT